MSEAVMVALITSAVSLIGAFITSKATNEKMANQLDKAVALLQADNQVIKEDVKEHNHYAKLFAETMPVVQEQIKVINKRIADLEDNEKAERRKGGN